MSIRDKEGKFIAGQSGNPSGRSKSSKLTKADKEALVKIVEDHVKDPNLLSEMLKFMLEKAENIGDVHKYLKEYAPFLTPKLSAIKQEIMEERTIILKVEGFEDLTLKTVQDLDKNLLTTETKNDDEQ